MSTLQLFLLGPPRVELAQQSVAIPRRKAQALLFFLAVTGVAQPRATLATLLWPEHNQQQAHGSLRRHLSELNLLLGHDCLVGDRESVRLAQTASLWLDVAEFHQAVAQCQTHGHPPYDVCRVCLTPLTRATTLYRDDFLTGFTLPACPAFDEWQFFQTETHRQILATALERLVHLHMDQNEPDTALTYARRRLPLDPLHEPAHRQLMRLYAATGQLAAAIRQYERCVQTLWEELEAPPEAETVALYEQIRRGRGQASRSTETGSAGNVPLRAPGEALSPPRLAPALAHNLPVQTTLFIGRQHELTEVARLCTRIGTRLVTILGPGGVGKTRLALEVARALVDSCPEGGSSGAWPPPNSDLYLADGIYFVSLAPLKAAEHIVPAIAEAINFQFQADGRLPQQQLLDYLAQKRLLLVLDNVEHLLDSVDLVDTLLQAAPHLRMLTTSRERLHLSSEIVFTLDAMAFPTWETPREALSYSAVQLFVETAQRVRPAFTVDPTDVQYVARICRLVGGMPLGIILAAAWSGVLSPQEIAAELTQGFDLLDVEFHDLPPRQRSMRAVLAYSWQRLTPAERAVLMRLAVFQGGFTRSAMETVAGASLRTIRQLVDKSFVQRTSAERYDLHELLRQYAAEQLHTAGQIQAVREAHCRYYLDFVAQREAALAGAHQVAVLAELSADFENIRAAWQWAVQKHNYTAIDQALEGFFRWFWMVRSRQHEGQALVRQAGEQWAPQPGQAPQPVWARLMARLMEQQGPWLAEPAAARKRIEGALACARRQNDRAEIAFCCWALGLAMVSEAIEGPAEPIELTLRRAACRCIESLRLYRTLDNRFYRAQVLETLGHCYRQILRLDRAMAHLQVSLVLRRKAGDQFGMARSFRELGFAAYGLGLGLETETAWQQAYELQRSLGDQQGIVDSIFFLCLLALTRDHWQTARALAEQTLAIAVNLNNAFYRRWADRAIELATSMEQTIQTIDSVVSPSHAFTAGRAALFYILFAPPVATRGYQYRLHQALALAVTDADKAMCLPFAAFTLAAEGELHQAVMLLGLAFRYPDIAEGWVSQLPEIVALQQNLQTRLSPTDFSSAWGQGQQLELSATIVTLQSMVSE